MHVRLKNTWFAGPTYGRFKPAARRLDTVEIPDELRPILPKSAEIMEGPIERVPVEAPVENHYADPDQLEATADAIAAAEKTADEQRALNQAKIKERLERELAQAAQLEEEAQAHAEAEAEAKLPETDDEELPETEVDDVDELLADAIKDANEADDDDEDEDDELQKEE